ncbi:MAG: hypothetical protein ACTSRF_16475 [Candidatus Freyarchaeota archaeon]
MSDVAVVQTLKKTIEELKMKVDKNAEEISRQLDSLTSFIGEKLTGVNRETRENLEKLAADLGGMFSNYRIELQKALEDFLISDEAVINSIVGSVSGGFTTEEKNVSAALSQVKENEGPEHEGFIGSQRESEKLPDQYERPQERDRIKR